MQRYSVALLHCAQKLRWCAAVTGRTWRVQPRVPARTSTHGEGQGGRQEAGAGVEGFGGGGYFSLGQLDLALGNGEAAEADALRSRDMVSSVFGE